MMHKAWRSIEEVPYFFSRSSIKFHGHTGEKIDDLNPIRDYLAGPRYQIPQICLVVTASWNMFSDNRKLCVVKKVILFENLIFTQQLYILKSSWILSLDNHVRVETLILRHFGWDWELISELSGYDWCLASADDYFEGSHFQATPKAYFCGVFLIIYHSSNKVCHPGGHNWSYYTGTLTIQSSIELQWLARDVGVLGQKSCPSSNHVPFKCS